ncbi:MAG: LytTR family DNA-binding domain-containing protein [Butyrivibrio sp.]|nr:LytTR family DNA-binding domain-containing protein [Acetatifactor muris]MCM1558427.1 LytTR family DNA-binding domain-containing protein [Butyrivibrio sp.]
MNIAIVEDEAVHSRLLQQYIQAWAEAGGRTVHIFLYENAESFLFSLEDGAPDAVFADIQMPGMNGMDMVRKLREKDGALPVIFTTGLSDYLREGYEVQALHYLIKPISAEKVAECMDRICCRSNVRNLFTVRTEDGMTKLDPGETNYCEAEGHYTRFAMTDKSSVRVLQSISELEKELPEKTFVKCHRSYLCNLENVKQIMQDRVIFDNGESVPVSRRLYQDFNRRFIEFYRGCEKG